MKLKNQVLKNQLSFWLLCKFTWIYKKMDFTKFDFSTSSYHNSSNNWPIDMFFTKKCNYFSRERRWNNSIFENSKIGATKKITDFSKLNCLTPSYHNSTNTGPIDMFFTKKCNYFSRETRWNHPLLSQPP